MDEAVRYRAKAEECRRHAEQMGLIRDREALLEMAKEWDALATWVESQAGEQDPPLGGPADD